MFIYLAEYFSMPNMYILKSVPNVYTVSILYRCKKLLNQYIAKLSPSSISARLILASFSRRPHRKMTSQEDNLRGRNLKRRQLTRRGHQGRQPHRKITPQRPQEDDFKERLQGFLHFDQYYIGFWLRFYRFCVQF